MQVSPSHHHQITKVSCIALQSIFGKVKTLYLPCANFLLGTSHGMGIFSLLPAVQVPVLSKSEHAYLAWTLRLNWRPRKNPLMRR